MPPTSTRGLPSRPRNPQSGPQGADLSRHVHEQHGGHRGLGLAVALVGPVDGVSLQDSVQVLLPVSMGETMRQPQELGALHPKLNLPPRNCTQTPRRPSSRRTSALHHHLPASPPRPSLDLPVRLKPKTTTIKTLGSLPSSSLLALPPSSASNPKAFKVIFFRKRSVSAASVL